MDGGLWGIATIIGPIALLAIMLWVILRNRQSKADDRATERATHENYEAEDRAVHREENL